MLPKADRTASRRGRTCENAASRSRPAGWWPSRTCPRHPGRTESDRYRTPCRCGPFRTDRRRSCTPPRSRPSLLTRPYLSLIMPNRMPPGGPADHQDHRGQAAPELQGAVRRRRPQQLPQRRLPRQDEDPLAHAVEQPAARRQEQHQPVIPRDFPPPGSRGGGRGQGNRISHVSFSLSNTTGPQCTPKPPAGQLISNGPNRMNAHMSLRGA